MTIKKEIANKNKCLPADVLCRHCKHWGFNNGKYVTGSGLSQCLMQKKGTFLDGYCKKFEIIK